MSRPNPSCSSSSSLRAFGAFGAVEAVEAFFKAMVLPVPRIERSIRKAFPSKRVSAGAAVYTTAALEHILKTIIDECETKRTSIKKAPKSIDRKILVSSVRSHPALCRLFRNYTFLPEKAIKLKKETLMTKADKLVDIAKRNASKEARKKKSTVPAVDEE